MSVTTLDEAIKTIPMLSEKLDQAVWMIRQQTRKIEQLEKVIGAEKRLNTKQAAEYLGIDPGTLRRRVKHAGLPQHQPADGGRPWYLKSELDKWQEQQTAAYRMSKLKGARE